MNVYMCTLAVKTCQPLTLSPFLSYAVLGGNENECGSAVRYSCEEGYDANDTVVSVCLENGTYSKQPPSCTGATFLLYPSYD